MRTKNIKIAIIGLGYVGLPLAIAFSRKYRTIGYDIDSNRVKDLQKGKDDTNEADENDLNQLKSIVFTDDLEDIEASNTYIVTVPTPINNVNEPDLTAIIKSTESLGSILKPGDTVIYESTVYPGLTEEVCVPILEQKSNLKANKDFFYGYSPERINPGDKQHRLEDIVKVTSGSNPSTAKKIDALYKSIITAGTYKVSNVKVAEAAKVIENIQRDVNIALVNELSLIFNKLEIDTEEVLKAAATKWNFHNYRPGLVGGHCIGVDPYYLTYKAEEIGIKPRMIKAGRSINEHMSKFVGSQVVSLMKSKKNKTKDAKVLILGFSFKADVPDYRNTKIVDLYHYLNNKVFKTDIFDPVTDVLSVKKEHDITLLDSPKEGYYDALILAVGHKVFREMDENKISKFCKKNHVLYDLSYSLSDDHIDGRL